MKAEEAIAALVDSLRERVRQRGSFADASVAMGENRNFLAAQVRTGRIQVGSFLKGLEALGDPLPTESFHTAFCRLDTDPAEILEAARERQKPAPDQYFREMAPRIARLEAPRPAANPPWQSRARKIEKLDQLRRRDRETAKMKLQRLITGMVERLETSGGPPKAYGELAWSLGVLAALHRYAGRRGDALDLLQAARPLTLLAGSSAAEGDWFVRAAILLVDLSRNARAHQFLLEAGSLFFLAGDTAKQAEAEIGRAHVLTHAGLHRASKSLLIQVLAVLEPGHLEARLLAHQILAKNLREMGHLAQACDHLAAAIELVGDDDLARASCLWSRGKLLDKLGDPNGAKAAFREALPYFARLTGAAELAELSMEYAKLLIQEGRRPELQELAAHLSGWIYELRGNRKLRDVVADFTALIELNELSELALQEIVRRIFQSKSDRLVRTEIPHV